MKKLVTALALLLCNVSSHASSNFTGSTILKIYEIGDAGKHAVGFYLSGVRDAEEIFRLTHELKQLSWTEESLSCIPAEATPEQLAKVLIKYINENPQMQHLAAFLLAHNSFKAAWPCPRSGD